MNTTPGRRRFNIWHVLADAFGSASNWAAGRSAQRAETGDDVAERLQANVDRDIGTFAENLHEAKRRRAFDTVVATAVGDIEAGSIVAIAPDGTARPVKEPRARPVSDAKAVPGNKTQGDALGVYQRFASKYARDLSSFYGKPAVDLNPAEIAKAYQALNTNSSAAEAATYNLPERALDLMKVLLSYHSGYRVSVQAHIGDAPQDVPKHT